MSQSLTMEPAATAALPNDLQASFEQDGFVNLGPVLGADDVVRLQQAAARLLGDSAQQRTAFASHRSNSKWEYHSYTDGKTSIAVDVVGTDAEFDALLEKMLSDSRVVRVLEALHGPAYKLTQVNIRKVVKGDPGLGYHQDTDGETGIGILLEDRPDSEGTTTFLPGSHRWPLTIRELFVYPRLGVTMLPAGRIKAATGKAGSMYFFINRLWHARDPMNHTEHASAILISIFTKGSKYRVHQVDGEILSRLGPVTRRLLDHNQGVRDAGEGLVEVIDPNPSGSPSVVEAVLKGRPKISAASPWQLLKPWRMLTALVTRLLGRG